MWPYIASGALVSLLGVVGMVGPDQEVNEAAAKLETTTNPVFGSHYSHPVYDQRDTWRCVEQRDGLALLVWRA